MYDSIQNPLISVIIPTYNPVPEYLVESINSVLQQTYTNWEIYIINDHSENPIEPILWNIVDNRIHVFNMEKNYGPGYCRNWGIKNCNGYFISMMDYDDIASPDLFEKQLLFFKNMPNADVVGTYAEFFGSKNGLLQPNPPKRRAEQQVRLLLENAAIPNGGAMFRRDFLIENNLSYHEILRSAEDYYLWVNVVKYTTLYCIKEPLFKYRRHDSQITTAQINLTQQCADEVRWYQLNQIKIYPNSAEKLLHTKLSRVLPLDNDDLDTMPKWIKKILKQNQLNNYFNNHYLKKWLYSRMCALSLNYFKKSKDMRVLFYVLRYLRYENIKHTLKTKLFK